MLTLIRRVLLTVSLGALLCGTLVRFAPGFDSDESAIDSTLSEASIEALRAERKQEGGLVRFYSRFLMGYVTGDWGRSRVLNQPVRSLIAERLEPTALIAAAGLALAWLMASCAAAAAGLYPKFGRPALSVAAGTLVSVPVALLALMFLLTGVGNQKAAPLVVALAVFPRLARYLDTMLSAAGRLPHVLTAHARGIPPAAIFLRHMLPCCRGEVAALAGVSLSFALSAAIPAEVVLDVAGIGQLAWQAALGRDLPLLVNVTVLITLVVVTANSFSDWAGSPR